ncbi:MAG TPA: hypothetical protein DIV86_04785, partial [Alphaproteobacteria bacterium]|nr:hypothetical protein [Alphaproteobacteria bacterium]
MIVIKKISNFLWHNPHAIHPVIIAHVNLGSAAGWNFNSLDENVRRQIIKKFPVLAENNENHNATSFISKICLFMQQEKFSV